MARHGHGNPSPPCGRAEDMQLYEKKAYQFEPVLPQFLEMVAAIKTIEILERDRVSIFWERGAKLLSDLSSIIEITGVPPNDGIP